MKILVYQIKPQKYDYLYTVKTNYSNALLMVFITLEKKLKIILFKLGT